MNETPFWLRNGTTRLFAIAHESARAPATDAFVFCHPLVEEKLWAHRVFVGFARSLASAGYAVLRFDLMGNGDSDGDFAEMSVETAMADVRCAVEEAKSRWPGARIHLLGLRFGATIAALVAERLSDIHQLVLWAPIVDGERYMQELLRTNLATQTAVYREVRYDRAELVEQMRAGATVNVDGYAMGFPLYSQAAAIKLSGAKKAHTGPCFVVQIERQAGRVAAELQQLKAGYEHGTLGFAQEEPFWKEIPKSYLRNAPNLFAVTMDWLRGQQRDDAQSSE